MPIRFNADEIFKMAERLEQNAATYYHTAAEKVTYPGARQLFLDLASWEEKHENAFSKLHEQISQKSRDEISFDPYGEAGQYLEALADQSIFDTSKSPLEQLGTEPQFDAILQFAIGKEKDTINFYTGIKHMVPKDFGEEEVEKIIREEMKHVTTLNAQLRKLTSE
ncbi:MAG: ferritin family protein [Lentisphaeria bacterium]